jgi:hypothetical protein
MRSRFKSEKNPRNGFLIQLRPSTLDAKLYISAQRDASTTVGMDTSSIVTKTFLFGVDILSQPFVPKSLTFSP